MLPRASPYSQIHSRNLKTALGWSYSLLCSHSPLSIAHPPSHKLLSRRSDCQVQWSSKHASTLASSTAINATKEIPTRVQELYDRLTTVKDNAASYVSLSRLQLALRGLETENPVVRIAVLGVDDQASARRLAKVLLVDPLSTELPWEPDLEKFGDDGRYLLLRYGEDAGIATENSLLRTLLVPSPLLKTHNLEVLIANVKTQSSVPIDGSPTVNPSEMMLVPRLELRASAGNQFTAINYPAHKSMLYGDGIHSCLKLGRLTVGWPDDQNSRKMMKIVFGLRAPLNSLPESVEDQVTAVDVALASSAIKSFRESLHNAIKYEHEWFQSGMPALAEWLVRDLDSAGQTIKPALRHLIQSLLDDAEDALMKREMQSIRTQAASAVPEDMRKAMKESLDVWAEHSHTELRDQLDIAFSGSRWRRLSWWKLLWRVDDVGMIASEILRQRWLVQAEKDIIWMAGRIEGAGFFRSLAEMAEAMDTLLVGDDHSKDEGKPDSVSTPPSHVESTGGTPKDDDHISTPPLGPWPRNISLARDKLSTEAIPSLESMGQLLLLQTLSTSILSSAFSALVYISWTGTSVYEVGAIAAFGIAWSLRRLQRKWETARQSWEGDVRETGRRALKDTQDVVVAIIDQGGKAEEPAEEVEERRIAKASIDMARQALKRLG